MKALAFLLALLWPSLALAAFGTPFTLGENHIALGTLTMSIPTTADAPVGTLIFETAGDSNSSNPNSSVPTDTAGNTYVCNALDTVSAIRMRSCWSFVTIDLPAPCTVTATETSTTLVVTAVVSCSSTDSLTVGMIISGGSFTGTISAPCVLIAGAATCTITGGATVAAPATATISSAVIVTFSATGGAKQGQLNAVSGATAADQQGTLVTGTGTNNLTITTGTLAYSSEIIFGYYTAVSGGGDGTGTEDPNYTFLQNSNSGGGSRVHVARRIVASNAATSYAPILSTSRQWLLDYQTFTDTSSSTPKGTLLGVLP